jgi:hypothetical protein
MPSSPPFGSSPSTPGQGSGGSTPPSWPPATPAAGPAPGAYPPPTAPSPGYPPPIGPSGGPQGYPPLPEHAYPVGWHASGPEQGSPQPTPPEEEAPRKAGIDIKPTQLAGGALAAVTSAVAASKFGVTGTVVGAAFGSVVSSVASAVYQTSLVRAHDRIRTIVVAPAGARGGTGTADPGDPAAVPAELTGAASPIVNDTVLSPNGLPWPPEPGTGTAPSAAYPAAPAPSRPSRPASTRTSKRYLKPALALGGFAFVASVGVISLSESVLGHPISDSKDTGTSIGSVWRQAADEPKPKPTTPAPSPDESGAPSASDSPSESPTDSPTDSPSESAPAENTDGSSSADPGQQNPDPQGGNASPGGDGAAASPTADAGQQAASPS